MKDANCVLSRRTLSMAVPNMMCARSTELNRAPVENAEGTMVVPFGTCVPLARFEALVAELFCFQVL